MKIVKGLKHLSHEGRPETIQPGQRKAQRDLSKETEPGLSQWRPVTGQEATGINWNTVNFV